MTNEIKKDAAYYAELKRTAKYWDANWDVLLKPARVKKLALKWTVIRFVQKLNVNDKREAVKGIFQVYVIPAAVLYGVHLLFAVVAGY